MRLHRDTILALLLTGSVSATLVLWRWEPQHRSLARADLFSRIEKGLYMGGSVDRPPRGTQAVLNLCSDRDPYRCDVHAWEPIPDRAPAPSLDWLRKQVAFVAAQRGAGRTTYVHCRAGISRSGMVVTAYLMAEHNWTRNEALAFVRTKRAMARPNPAFMELLLEWERTLKK